MHRFLIDPSDIQDGRVHFAEEISLQMKKVLRLRSGNEVVVFDGGGVDYQVRLEVVETKTSLGTVLSANDSHNEPGIFITLYQALIRSERYEYALQKGVETGISRFVPFTSERTEVSIPSQSKMGRWRRIIKEAAEQSGRSVVPQLSDPILFSNMIKNIRDTEKLLGSVDYTLSEKKKKSRQFSRSLFIVKDVKAGEKITKENVRSIRPGFGMHPKHLSEIIGKEFTKNIEKGTPLLDKYIKKEKR